MPFSADNIAQQLKSTSVLTWPSVFRWIVFRDYLVALPPSEQYANVMFTDVRDAVFPGAFSSAQLSGLHGDGAQLVESFHRAAITVLAVGPPPFPPLLSVPLAPTLSLSLIRSHALTLSHLLGNPFKRMTDNGYYVFLESKSKVIGDCQVNSGWVRHCWGQVCLMLLHDHRC